MLVMLIVSKVVDPSCACHRTEDGDMEGWL